jgi:surface protein
MSIVDKLQTIQNIKENIKTAINNKGGNVGDDFTQYSAAIDSLSTGGITKIDVAETGIKFGNSTFKEIPDFYDFSNVTNMSDLFDSCRNLTSIPQLQTGNVTNMSYMFSFCDSLTSIPQLDTSNVTNMYAIFYGCSSLQTIPQLDTSNIKDMGCMFQNATNLISLPALNTTKVTNISSYFGTKNIEKLTDVGGWIGLKINWKDDYGLVKCPNLTYQSCVNILNGLADVTELGSRTLKVHQNFLDAVGDEISIGTSKNWVITA